MVSHRRVSVITGASKGIGFVTAQRLDKAGHDVVGLARQAPSLPFPGEFIEVDLADAEATANVAIAIAKRYAVSHLVNNVGLVRSESVEEVDLDGLSAVLDLNLRPAVQLTQAFLPSMKEQGYGRIINVSSLVVSACPCELAMQQLKQDLLV
jgi:3-oxoacyl-[acyl-carrier protein] reductase